jgi:hypothetical protein
MTVSGAGHVAWLPNHASVPTTRDEVTALLRAAIKRVARRPVQVISGRNAWLPRESRLLSAYSTSASPIRSTPAAARSSRARTRKQESDGGLLCHQSR